MRSAAIDCADTQTLSNAHNSAPDLRVLLALPPSAPFRAEIRATAAPSGPSVSRMSLTQEPMPSWEQIETAVTGTLGAGAENPTTTGSSGGTTGTG